MQGLDPAAEALRGPGIVGHFLGLQSSLPQSLEGASGGQQGPAQLLQALGQGDQAGFVVDRKQGSGHEDLAKGHCFTG